jgi:hypothetical protein
MYYLEGLQNNLRNILLLIKSHGLEVPTSMPELKKQYLAALSQVQPMVQRSQEARAKVVEDGAIERHLMDFYVIDSVLNDKDQKNIFQSEPSLSEVRNQRRSRLHGAIDRLRTDIPQYAALFDLVVSDIISPDSRRAGGGTTSAAVSVIWANVRDKWSDVDLLELLIHEHTHNLMFLDELCHSHYNDYDIVANRDYYAKSAILSEKRPLDKALHSLVVATEVYLARQNYHYLNQSIPVLHPTDAKLREQSLSCVESIKEIDRATHVLTDRGRYLVDKCKQCLSENFCG